MQSSFSLTIKTLKSNPIIWIIPLLVWKVRPFMVFNPLEWLADLINFHSHWRNIFELVFKLIVGAAGFTFLFAIISVIINQIFCKNYDPFFEEFKKYFRLVFTLMLAVLWTLNIFDVIIQGILLKMFDFVSEQGFNSLPGLVGYYLSYILTSVKWVFLYYISYIWINGGIKVKKSFLSRLKKSLFSSKVAELLVLAMLVGLIMAVLYYYPHLNQINYFKKASSPDNLFGLLNIIAGYRNPWWFDILITIYSALIHTFLIVYSAVIYYCRY